MKDIKKLLCRAAFGSLLINSSAWAHPNSGTITNYFGIARLSTGSESSSAILIVPDATESVAQHNPAGCSSTEAFAIIKANPPGLEDNSFKEISSTLLGSFLANKKVQLAISATDCEGAFPRIRYVSAIP